MCGYYDKIYMINDYDCVRLGRLSLSFTFVLLNEIKLTTIS